MKEKITIIKVGGKIVENDEFLTQLLLDFSEIEGYKILVHGGGKSATQLSERLGIETHMHNGRRITDKETLDVTVMVYAGLINKRIVAKLQKIKINALGLTGADMNIIRSEKRPVKEIDYGFVGDVKEVNIQILSSLIKDNVIPILAPLTHDGEGNMLNTNADTIAGETAKALAKEFEVTLTYCFEKKGVMTDINDDSTVIRHLDKNNFEELVAQGIVNEGMIPKIENALNCIKAGVKQVIITQSTDIQGKEGTVIQ